MKTLIIEDWVQLQEVFDNAADLEPATRIAYLDTISSAMRVQVEALLQVLDTGTLAGRVVGAAAVHAMDASLPETGERLGPYRIVEVIGRGGMSVVYRAVRADETYQQEVAIKAAPLGLHSPQLKQRFLDERQILANLEHPNITRLIDGGTTAEGIPYVVMELISGKPIDAWCEDNHLSLPQRIRLMVKVARAVSYAHQHLVVHRDLKPDNIYINDEGVPKLLDFGIAKALDPQGAHVSGSMTVDISRLMTPEYASPEQVRGDPVTTATDVYQLGIVLYLLLTGERPFRAVTGRMADLENAICFLPPPRPNLSHDLNLILLKTLEKEPAHRYASAGALADDLERYLTGFPVHARMASWSYRTGKFVRRNKLAVTSAVLVFLLLVGFSVATMLQEKRLARERDTAQRERDSAQKVADFLSTVFSSADPEQNRGKDVTARQLLDQGAANIDHDLDADPVVKERLLFTLGNAYEGLSVYDRAQRFYERSLALRRQLFGDPSKQVANSLTRLTYIGILADRTSLAEQNAEQMLRMTRSLYGDWSEDTATALQIMAMVRFFEGKFLVGEDNMRQAIAIKKKLHGADNPETVKLFNMLSNIMYLQGDYAGAESLLRQELSVLEHGNWQDSDYELEVSDSGTKLGQLLELEGRDAEAETVLRQMLSVRIKMLGSKHNWTGETESMLAIALIDEGKLEEADKFIHDALAIHQVLPGADTLFYGVDETVLAHLDQRRGQDTEAMRLLTDALTITQKHCGMDSIWTARAYYELGLEQTRLHQHNEAIASLQFALATERKFNGNSPYSAKDELALRRLNNSLRPSRTSPRGIP